MRDLASACFSPVKPTNEPSDQPANEPTAEPTAEPTSEPTAKSTVYSSGEAGARGEPGRRCRGVTSSTFLTASSKPFPKSLS